MTAKRKARELQQDTMDSAHKIWLAGLGALAVAEEEGSKLFRTLVDKGEGIEKRGRDRIGKAKGKVEGVRSKAESYRDSFTKTLDDQVTAVIHRLGVPTKEEIEALINKVEELTKSVEKMRSKRTAKPRARTTKSSASKSSNTSEG